MRRYWILFLLCFFYLVSGLPAVAADDPARTNTDIALSGTMLRDVVTYSGEKSDWTIYVRPGIRFSDRDRTVGYLDFLVPLYSTDKSLLFFNPKASFDDRDNVEWNVGIGYRHLLLNDKMILGGNVFYDGRKSWTGYDYHQIGVGAEFLTEWVNARLNGYISLSEAQEVDRWREYYFGPTSLNYSWAYRIEEPLSGLDYEVGFKIPGLSKYVETWVYGGGYTYFADYTDDMVGWGGRIEVIPTDFLKLNFAVKDDNLRGTEYSGEVTVEVPFSIENLVAGKNPFAGIGTRFGGSRTMNERLYEQVRRDVDIVIKDTDYTRETAPGDVIPGDTSESQNIVYVNNSNTSGIEDGSLEHPWNTVEEGLADSRVPDSWVFVFKGNSTTTPYTGIYTLPAGTTLWGEGYDLYGMGFTGFPEITGASISPNGVINLASNNTVMGLAVSTTNGYKAVFGDGVTNVNIHHNLIYNASLGIYFCDSAGALSGIDISDNVINLHHTNTSYNCYPIYFAGAVTDVDIINNNLTARMDLPSGTTWWNDAAGILFTHNYWPNSASDIDGLRIIGNTINVQNNNGHYDAGILIDAGVYGGGYYGLTWAYNGSMLKNFTIADNTIATYGGKYAEGIAFGASSNGVIGNNEITMLNSNYSYGIDNYNTSLGSVTGVTIDNNRIDIASSGAEAIGFDLWAYDAAMTISNNTVTLPSVTSCLLGANIVGVGGTANYTLTGNSFTGVVGGAPYDYGIDIWNNTGSTTLSVSLAHNKITRFDSGVWVETGVADLGNGSLGSAGYNSITGFTAYAIINSTGVGVIAQKNWWGGVPVSSWFSGSVDYSHPLTSAP